MRSQYKLGSVLAGLLLIAPVTSFAQKRGEPPGGGSTSPTSRATVLGRDEDILNREWTLRLLSEGKSKAPQTADERKFIVSQIFEDFERMQVVNREMMQASSNLNVQTYKRISTLADEINKRAKRLKTNLGIPDPAEQDKKDHEENAPALDAAQLKASMQSLDGSVKSFVNSPIFKNPRVATVGQLHNLRRDIANVIELSRTVKKTAGKLH